MKHFFLSNKFCLPFLFFFSALFSLFLFCSKPAPTEDASLLPPAQVEALALSDTRIQISWQRNAHALSYNVYRDTASSGNYDFIASAADTVVIDTGLSAGQKYFYRVRAWSEASYSALSFCDSAVTLPSAPKNFLALPLSSTAVRLAWSRSLGEMSYVIFRSFVDSTHLDSLAGTTDTLFIDSAAASGILHYYALRSSGISGPSALSRTKTALLPPAAPALVQVAVQSSSALYITWKKATGADSYVVFRKIFSGTQYDSISSPADTSFSNQNLASSTLYLYKIKAKNQGGISAFSSADSAITLPAWNVLEKRGISSGEASSISMAMNLDTPYVAFKDGANMNRLSVMKFNGSSWQYVGGAGFSGGSADYVSLALYQGMPYVAFKDHGTGGKALLVKWDGSSWSAVGGAAFSDSTADLVCLCMDGGIAYVAYRDGRDSLQKLSVMKYDGSSWASVGQKGFSDSTLNAVSLAVANSTPYVCFSDAAHGYKLTAMRYTGSAWEALGVKGFSDGEAAFVSLAISQGNLFAAFCDGGQGFKARVMQYASGSWSAFGSTTLTAAAASYTSLLFENTTAFLAAFEFGVGAEVLRATGGTWEALGGKPVISGTSHAYVALAEYNGTPLVAFQDGGAARKLTVVRYR